MLLLAAAAILPTAALASVDDRAALSAFAQARAADGEGEVDQAAERYAAALALSPDNHLLAGRALRQALAAGNRQLAVDAARILEKSGQLTPDGRLLLFAEALRQRQWREASLQIDRIHEDEVFSFMTPLLRAWVAQGSRKGDPLAILDTAAGHALAAAYAAEHRPLLLLARGKEEEGVAALARFAGDGSGHHQRLRIAGAASLARRGERKLALSLLEGEAPPIAAARARIEARKSLKGEISTAQAGIANLLVRLAVDLNAQNAPELSLSFARLATFLAPESSEAWLVTAELLGAQDQHQAGLAALSNIEADDPFAANSGEVGVRLLSASGRQEDALEKARIAAHASDANADDWVQLADVYAALKKTTEAAEAYERALAAPVGANPKWAIWVMRGGALIEDGRWPEARKALQTAYELAPQEPVVLNYLGYSQLERRENLEEAEKLIREASRLQPGDAAITDSLGWAQYLRGNLTEAIKTLEQAVKGQPADPAINEHLGDAYYSAGRRVDARYAWSAALVYADEDAARRLRAKIESGLKPELASP